MSNETAQQAARRLFSKQVEQGYAATALYEYTESNGQPIYYRARLDHPKKGKYIRPFHLNGNGYQTGEPNINPKPLYGLHRLADNTDTVFIVEGEKAANALIQCGYIAVTSGSASSAGNADWRPLKGRGVVIWPDNDEPGNKYAQDVIEALEGISESVRLIDISTLSLPPKGDCVDWVQTLISWDGIKAISESDRQQLQPIIDALIQSAGTSQKSHIEWNTPGTIQTRLQPVPVLPDEIIPEPFRVWIKDISHRMQTPPDFAAVTAMVVTGSIIGTACTVRPKQRDDWTIPPNTWGACIGRPSVVLKSPSMKEPMNILGRLQSDEKEILEAALKNYGFDELIQEAKRKQLDKDIQKAATAKQRDTLKIESLREEYNAIETEPVPARRLFKTNETSIQSQTVLQVENPRGLLTFRDELTGLLTRWDKAEHEDERAYFLEGWNGNGSYTDFKIGRGLTEAPHICISLFGGIQPDKLKRYLYQSMNGGNDGMMQRFQLAVYPDEPDTWQLIDDHPNTTEKTRAYDLLKVLADADFTQWGAEQGEYDQFPSMRFSEQGQTVFNDWLTELHTRKLATEDNPLICEHLGKYRSLMPSLALIIHLIDVADGASPAPISEHAAMMAAAWCDYLESHARRIYGMIQSPEREAAATLAEHIKAGKLDNPFTVKHVYDKGWYMLKERVEVEAACHVLEDEYWLICEKPRLSSNKGGRPKLAEYWINPAVMADE